MTIQDWRDNKRGPSVALLLLLAVSHNLSGYKGHAKDVPKQYVGNEACANCHAGISKSYRQTPMSHASGPALENLIPADFTHGPSGVHYRIYTDRGGAWLAFDRQGGNPIQGKRELLYYIGSGRRGLTYLFADDGFVFESPINWYGDEHEWDMTPAYGTSREMPLNLPAHTGCLHCHVSGMRPPIERTENRYQMPLLSDSGVSCERCHGPGAAHAKGGAITNPAKLDAERRDAVCMQCHMEGLVSVERRGHHIYEYQPGDLLEDYVRYYVLKPSSAVLGGVSQVEALQESGCKKKAKDRMSCTSCHDPHYSPTGQERASYFREKCLACHGTAFGSSHHVEQKDCTICHMPAGGSKDVAHTQVTDHRIPRLATVAASSRSQMAASQDKFHLSPFPDSPEAEDDIRDLALAWELMADRGREAARTRALNLLRSSVEKFPDDAATLSALGYEEQLLNNVPQARQYYRHALDLDPTLIEASSNLGVIEAQTGNLNAAAELLKIAFDRAPGRSSVGMNLARVFCLMGRRDDAQATVERVLEFNPDLSAAKAFLSGLKRTNPSCN
jgi:predicted CXXCH cytochrome family protein